jgi:DNA-binding LacI/PurR family transcriptional regulator
MSESHRPTIIDVARTAGVSPATVSNALNGRRYVDADTKEKVKATARRLGYTPNLRARRLRTGSADTIALLSSMPFAVSAGPSRLGFLMEIAAVAAATALENELALVLVPPLERARLPLDDLPIDGALIIEPTEDDPNTARLLDRGLPVVSIGRPGGAKGAVPFVDLHSAYTARLLLEHLHAQAARRIALLIGAQSRNSYQETEAVYREFARGHKMRLTIVRIDESGGEDAAQAATLRLLQERPELDALCVPVDAFAVGANRALAELGRNVPADVKLVTRYDGLRARECNPALTAVDLHLGEVASLAVKLLLAHMRGESTPRSVSGPLPDLIARASSQQS